MELNKYLGVVSIIFLILSILFVAFGINEVKIPEDIYFIVAFLVIPLLIEWIGDQRLTKKIALGLSSVLISAYIMIVFLFVITHK